MRYGNLTAREIKVKADAGHLVIVPTGCTEQQGPHLTVDFDTWFVEALMVAASEYADKVFDVKSLVLPAMPFGPTPEHRDYGSGYINVPADIHNAVVKATLTSLIEQGFQRIVVWRGCGGHDLQGVIAQINQIFSGQANIWLPDHPYHAIWCRIGDPNVAGGHADSFTTSMALYLRPESVRVDQIVNPNNLPVDWNDPKLSFAKYSSTGVIGDPTYASATLGEKLWTATVESVSLTLHQIAEEPIEG